MVEQLELHTFTAQSPGSIPGGGNKILQPAALLKIKKEYTHLP